MTRKRYVKLLMACGFPRNDCQEAAQAVRVTECSYQNDMKDWLSVFRWLALPEAPEVDK